MPFPVKFPDHEVRKPLLVSWMQWTHIFICILLSATPFAAIAQPTQVKFDRLDINQGLSQNHVMCIFQDSRGFMWFGTRDGLNKYDGYNFKVYKNNITDSTTLSNNFISALAEDANGFIWVATRGGGLSRYDRRTDNFRQYNKPGESQYSLPSNLITDLIVDRQNMVWVCSEDGGLTSMDPVSGKIIIYRHDPGDPQSLGDNNTRCVYQDRSGKIWVGTFGGGLSIFDPVTKKFRSYRHNSADPSSLSNDNVVRLFEDSHQRMWIGTSGGGLNLFDPGSGKFIRFMAEESNPNSIPGNVVFAISEGPLGNIWIGTENGGLSIYNPVSRRFGNYKHDEIDRGSLSNNSIYAIYQDTYGTMWVGTFAGGINLYNKNGNKFAHYKHTSDPASLSHNNVLSISKASGGKIWIGTDGGGLNRFDPATRTYEHFLHKKNDPNTIAGNYVLSVLEDSRGQVWVGTWDAGVSVFDPITKKYRHFKHIPGDTTSLSSNNVWVVMEDRNGTIWLGTYNGGLLRYNAKESNFTRFTDDADNTTKRKVHAIAEGMDGKLWIGTDGGGLLMLDKATGKMKNFVHQEGRNSLSDNRITNISVDKKGNLWISTMVGLNYFDLSTGVFTNYTTEDGLPNNVIFGMLEDKSGRWWISTNRGLSRFSPATGNFKNFSVKDGLQSYEFKMRAYCKTDDGTMYFGGIEGFNQFRPENITEAVAEFPMLLTGFQIFNKEVPITPADDSDPLSQSITETKEIVINYNQSVITFEYASLNYIISASKEYAYKLEGFDKDWNIVGTQRMATYTNLDPGTYVFMVKALNSDGKWSSNVASVKLIVKPPFWLTWWFRIGFILLVAGSIAAFYLVRLNNVKRQRELLKQKVDEQTIQLVHAHVEEHNARIEAENAREEADNANRELEKKNKELEQFVYIASHDLREPLRTTTSFIQLFQKQYQSMLDQRGLQYLGFISQAADRMRTLIDDLLEYSKIGNHRDLQEVNCDNVIREVLADLGTAIRESGAIVNAGVLPVIQGYPTAIKQLFQNLLANGIKFRRPGIAPEISITATEVDNKWQFAFADNGIGIAPQYRERIFVIFQRLHSRKEYEGSGIGLAHCRKIVELHKGKIWVESEPGAGTTFYFTLQADEDPT